MSGEAGSRSKTSINVISDPEVTGACRQSLTTFLGKCCVLNCPNSFNFKNPHPKKKPPSGFKMKEDYNIMFPLPKEPKTFAQWQKYIPQYKEWKLGLKQHKNRICSAHFRQDDMFKKSYTFVADNGDNIELKTKYLTYLKQDAVPVFFDGPGVPKYIANRNKFRRKAPKERPAPKLPAAMKKKMDEADISVKAVEYDDDEYRTTGVVTPTSSPVMFEPYSPVYKETDDDIEFTDQVIEMDQFKSSYNFQPQSTYNFCGNDVTKSQRFPGHNQEVCEIILPIIVSTTSMAKEDVPSSCITSSFPQTIPLPLSNSNSSTSFVPIDKVVDASAPHFAILTQKLTPVKATSIGSSTTSPANAIHTEDKNLPSQNSTDAQNLLDILTENIEITDDTESILTYEDFMFKSKDIPLPSSQWALQKHPSNKFVSFSYVDVHPSGSLSEKRVLFNGNLSPRVWLDGIFKDNFNFTEITSLYNCYKILHELHKMIPCPGTNHPAQPYSTQCSIYMKHHMARCTTCASKRKFLLKRDYSESRRLKRDAAAAKKDAGVQVITESALDNDKAGPSNAGHAVPPAADKAGEGGRSLETLIMAAANAELLLQQKELLAIINPLILS